MSLAGLDAPAVVAAHQAALAEPTGWFLLRYVAGSRDTIELLQRGSAGVNEARTAVEGYEEKSPLYGLVQYRRRKVTLKYVPDGTSRVLQVRLTVQFQSVLDAFPTDTTFSFSAPSELSESAIALCTMHLPAKQGSLTSSDSSLRRRRLKEISEDAEENTAPRPVTREVQDVAKPQTALSKPRVETETNEVKEASPSIQPPDDQVADELPASAMRARALLAKRKESEAERLATQNKSSAPVQAVAEPAKPNVHPLRAQPVVASTVPTPLPPSQPVDKSLPATPEGTPPHSPGGVQPSKSEAQQEGDDEPESGRPSLTAEHLERSRHLSGTGSNDISQWTTDVAAYADFKPKKKKLGPRPHVETKRPRTSGNSEDGVRTRPVANLPTTVRVSSQRPPTSNAYRPGSQQSSKSVPGRFTPTSHANHILPPLPSPTHIASFYRPESRRTVSQAPSIAADSSNATPEKMRLMKALQLRKRNMLMSQRVSASTVASSHTQSESLASTNTSRGMHPSGSTVRTEPNILGEPFNPGKTQASNTTSPTEATASEHQSNAASSFTSQEEAKRRESLSSDTSSSITPRADQVIQKRKSTRSRQRSAKLEEQSSGTTEIAKSDKSQPKDKVDSPAATSENEDMIIAQKLSEALSRAPKTSVKASEPKLEQPTDKQLGGMHHTMSNATSRSKRGLAVPEPLRVPSPGGFSETSDADSLMDELENATVQEAKPVSVARTPVTPVMSKITSWKDSNRSVSTPAKPNESSTESLSKPKSSGGRSASTALPSWPPVGIESVPVPLTKKSTLGTGISKRIKALEVVTARNTSPPRQPVKPEPSTQSAFSKFMKRSSLIMNQQVPNTSTDASPPKKLQTPSVSPEREPLPQASRPWVQRQGSGPPIMTPQKGETISVTARIIRNEGEEGPAPKSAPGDVNLYRSPLIVEHEKQNETHSPFPRDASAATVDSSLKSPTRGERSGRFSFSSHRSMSAPRLNTADSTTSKMSSLVSSSFRPFPKSTSDHSSIAEDKPKQSRANRFMKRMSNLTSGRKAAKNNAASSYLGFSKEPQPATIEERYEVEGSHQSLADSLLHVVDIGDVNVQFPESLLWKRRFIRIDDQGYLIFSPPANDPNMRSVARKYHLSDFRTPALPDPEREEMAWSIVLDMRDGSSVQCACENRSSQKQVLQMLVDAHSAYHQLYGES